MPPSTGIVRMKHCSPVLTIIILLGIWSSPTFGQVTLRLVRDDAPGESEKKEEGDNGKDKEKEDDPPAWWSAHGQATLVSQGNWKFRSPYEGPNSLTPNLNYRTTATATLYLDARIWEGGEVIFNPEMAGGQGLSQTLGLAGFPNGEATRVGLIQPTPYVARLLYKQTWELGGEMEKVEDGPNRIAGQRAVDRLTVRIGKMAATDIFDDNTFSHDPRTQFLNWALMYNGAWDYPANTRGYTYGATVELNHKDWAVRYGVFAEPTVANGQDIDPRFLQANGHALEWEQRYAWREQAGKLRLMAYLNNAHMGDYRESLQLQPTNPDITATRVYRVKYGFGLNWEQKISEELGVFARLGWNDGHTESWAFTEIDATGALGLLLAGKRWCRPGDTVGVALVVNGLSNGHRDYLAAGGLGFIIGDGRLRYGEEEILESFYNWQIKQGINVTFDFQGVNNPAFNRDRGPVAIAGARVHFEF
jgi:high affinity Mn2+ porin